MHSTAQHNMAMVLVVYCAMVLLSSDTIDLSTSVQCWTLFVYMQPPMLFNHEDSVMRAHGTTCTTWCKHMGPCAQQAEITSDHMHKMLQAHGTPCTMCCKLILTRASETHHPKK